jgi:hypothetical protein
MITVAGNYIVSLSKREMRERFGLGESGGLWE